MKNSLKKLITIILTALIFSCSVVQIAEANGVKAVTVKSGSIYKITLSSQEKSKGLRIVAYSIKNGKTINISYSFDQKEKKPAEVIIDQNSVIAPFRVITTNTDNLKFRPFNDIYNTEADEYIRHLHDAGIIAGSTDGSFKPNNTITRAEVAVMLCNALNLNIADKSYKNPYKDTSNHWAKNYISAVSKKGIMSGNNGKFRPNDRITVAEVCVITNKAFTFNTKSQGVFTKLHKNKWYSNDVKKIFDLRILTPQDSIYNTFNEEKPISKGNFAMMLSRALCTY
jgi:major membrane immunogen (membrane-anchored lipoprotein)